MRQPSEGFPLCACKPCVRLYPHRPSLYDKPVHLSLDFDKPCGLWVPYLLKDSLWPALKGCSRCCHQSGGSVIQRRIVALRFESQSWKKSLKVLVSYFNQFSMTVTFESTSPNLSLKMTQSVHDSSFLRFQNHFLMKPLWVSGWPVRPVRSQQLQDDPTDVRKGILIVMISPVYFRWSLSWRRGSWDFRDFAAEGETAVAWQRQKL